MAKATQYDAHVRARKSLIRKVVDRYTEQGMGIGFGRRIDKDPAAYAARKDAAAEAELVEFSTMVKNVSSGRERSRWRGVFGEREYWGNRFGKYYTFGPPQAIVGQHKEVPMSVIQSIAIGMIDRMRKTEPGKKTA